MVWIFIAIHISLRKVSKMLSSHMLPYFPLSKDILSLHRFSLKWSMLILFFFSL